MPEQQATRINYDSAIRAVVVALLVCITFSLVCLKADMASERFRYRCLAFFEYGDSPNEVGLLDVPGIPRSGPESFWVDSKGDVFICDTVNSRILHFSNTGQVESAVQLGFMCNDVVVDERGNLLVLDWSASTLHYMSPSGHERQSSYVAPELLSAFCRLGINEENPVLITGEQIEYELPGFGELVPLAVSASSRTAASGLSGKHGARVTVRRTEIGLAEVSIRRESTSGALGSLRETDTVLLPADDVLSVEFLGEDASGDLFFQLERSVWGSNEILLQVYLLRSSGEAELVIDEIPNDYWLWTAKLLQVNEHGDVYQLLPTPSGVYLNVWERRGGK